MTHLCYTLDEAAQRLNLSETVLVRLSQYFKVPRAAYEELGYLSFKGDLTFSDADIAFFGQVKSHLLAGESLDEVKSRMRAEQPVSPGVSLDSTQPVTSTPASFQDTLADTDAPQQDEAGDPFAASFSEPTPDARNIPAPEPLQAIQDRTPYEQAAAESFERYKSAHRTGLAKVFEKMIREVGGAQSDPERKREALPHPRPLRGHEHETAPPETPPSPDGDTPASSRRDADRVLPFRPRRRDKTTANANPATAHTAVTPQPASPSALAPTTASTQPDTPDPIAQHAAYRTLDKIKAQHQQRHTLAWDALITQAASRPRPLNTHLSQAARALRERAFQRPSDSRTSES